MVVMMVSKNIEYSQIVIAVKLHLITKKSLKTHGAAVHDRRQTQKYEVRW